MEKINDKSLTHFKARLDLDDQLLHKKDGTTLTAKQVALSGKPRPMGLIPLRSYFNSIFGTDLIRKSIINTNNEIKAIDFITDLEKNGWETVYKNISRILEESKSKITEVLLVKNPGCMISFTVQYRSSAENITAKQQYKDQASYSIVDPGDLDFIEALTIYASNEVNTEELINELSELANLHIRHKHTGAEIGIVSIQDNEYYVKNFSLESKTPKFVLPDLHYGEGFEEFHNKMLKRLETTTKGLILLHGDPGCGKTHYIRILLKELSKINKSILYAPPSLSASLTDPSMIEFISDWVLGEERDCILLIEDAEPLLEVRGGADGRSIGISNLLNMTDGLLNDILGLTVIATFNTQLSKIDPALLRPQRLMARKEFNKLSEEQSKKLAEALNVEIPSHIKFPMSLADFYASKNESDILIHTVKVEARIGFTNR